MAKKRIYSYGSESFIDAQLPIKVREAMSICGWNAFGIYELVGKVLRAEKRAAKKSNPPSTGRENP